MNFYKLIKSLINKKSPVRPEVFKEACIIPQEKHCISHHHIHPNAISILCRLKRHHYQAYLVGGGVRDLLLGKQPKDFDIVTDAKPEQIKALFRNCRLIGRRFRLAHIYFNDITIEVSTFRATSQKDSKHYTKNGMILRDNIYGNIKDDAWRRDFTINALYYDNATACVLDFTDGIIDLNNRTLRIIGDAKTRYREDPVRMLRAVRLAAKLDFDIEKSTQTPLFELGELLQEVASTRLFDELLKMFRSGTIEKTFVLLCRYNLLKQLLPLTNQCLGNKTCSASQLITLGLQQTDQRFKQGRTIATPFLFALLLWPAVIQHQKDLLEENNISDMQAFIQSYREVLREQCQYTTIPKYFRVAIEEIWLLQYHFKQQRKRRIKKILHRPRFRAAFDLLMLRAKVDKSIQPLTTWWQRFHEASISKSE